MTTTFVCDCCGTIDDISATRQETAGWTCHQCKTGEWHNFFPQEQWDESNPKPMLNRVNSASHPDL